MPGYENSVLGNLPVIIIGAGPGGLTLAQGLRKRNVKFRIFERDLGKGFRSQGWAVTLQWVVPDLLNILPDDLPPVEVISHLYDLGLSDNGSIFDGITGEEKDHFGSHNRKGFIRADRLKLREWLSTNIDIEWDKNFERFVEHESGVTTYFTDGTKVEGCMLIGAEGATSKVRDQLVGAENSKLTLLPIDLYIGNATMTRAQYLQHFQEFARSLYIVQSPTVYLFVGLHHISDDQETAYYYWVVSRHHTELEKASNHSTTSWSKQRLYDAALGYSSALNPKFRDILRLSGPEDMVQVPSFMDTWVPPDNGFSTGRVTLLGDTAHKMTPFRGMGINHAMQDCVDFCRILDTGCESIQEMIKKYEVTIIPRGSEAVRATTESALNW